jgi:predicted transcriptional regulator
MYSTKYIRRKNMSVPKIFESEYRFCLILWEKEPILAKDLAVICKERLEWSRPTTYTVIRRLAERGVLVNENSVVRSIVSKSEVQLSEFDEIFEKRFENSLPAFITAFAKHQKLSESEIEEIRRIIEHGDK